MSKILVSLPNDLVKRMNVAIPPRKRSKLIVDLLEKEILRRETALFQCAKAVDADEELNREMLDWEVTVNDGIEPEAW